MADESQNLESILDNADQLFDENHFQEVYDTLLKYHVSNYWISDPTFICFIIYIISNPYLS